MLDLADRLYKRLSENVVSRPHAGDGAGYALLVIWPPNPISRPSTGRSVGGADPRPRLRGLPDRPARRSTASCRTRSCRSFSGTRSSATVVEGDGAVRARRAGRRAVARLDLRRVPVLPDRAENLCDRARFTGYTLDGGYAEDAVADQRYCFPIPDGSSDAERRRCCAPG